LSRPCSSRRLGDLAPRVQGLRPAGATAGALAVCGLLGGCVSAGAPAIPFFGAYFPSWLLCALLGILGAVVIRLVFIRTGIDDALPARLPVYLCIAAALGFLVSLIGFGR